MSRVAYFDYLLSELAEYQPDATFVDYDMLQPDPLASINKIRSVNQRVFLIITADLAISDTELDTLSAYGYILRKPYKPDSILRILSVILNEFKPDTTKINASISKELNNIGISPHLSGYKYLRDGILFYVNAKGEMRIGDIYERLASKYGKNVHCIERSMRNAIENAWINGNVDYINSVFGYTIKPDSGKPSNREFIAMLSDKYISLHK
ncbi:MAG TPA: sporulation initiation factor Spo0A C-terminal domain-containing protein [Clostridia bacterium]|nr:sporulation initiation factor Spo0A C-terminal domain-containing protein [Clostridia bacterium]